MKIRNKNGYTLIELIISLGIIVILGALIFILVPKVMSSYKAQSEINNINNIRSAVNSLFLTKVDYRDLTTKLMINSKSLPDTLYEDMKGENNVTLLNGFKGEVTIEGLKSTTGNYSPSGNDYAAYMIRYKSIPQDECVKIVSGVSSDFYNIAVGTTDVQRLGGELNKTTLAKACKNGGDNNKLEFVSL